MSKQKFQRGDLVHVAKDLGPTMRHFTADVDAIVLYSYKDRYGGGSHQERIYALELEGHGSSAWYDEHQLTLVMSKQNFRKWRTLRKKAKEHLG